MAAGCCPVHAFVFAWPRLGCCMSLVDSGYNVLLLRQCLLSPYSGKKKKSLCGNPIWIIILIALSNW